MNYHFSVHKTTINNVARCHQCPQVCWVYKLVRYCIVQVCSMTHHEDREVTGISIYADGEQDADRQDADGQWWWVSASMLMAGEMLTGEMLTPSKMLMWQQTPSGGNFTRLFRAWEALGSSAQGVAGPLSTKPTSCRLWQTLILAVYQSICHPTLLSSALWYSSYPQNCTNIAWFIADRVAPNLE